MDTNILYIYTQPLVNTIETHTHTHPHRRRFYTLTDLCTETFKHRQSILVQLGGGKGVSGGGAQKNILETVVFQLQAPAPKPCYRLPGSHLAHATWLALSPRFRKCIETKRETGREGAKEIKPQEGTNRFSSVSPSWLDQHSLSCYIRRASRNRAVWMGEGERESPVL